MNTLEQLNNYSNTSLTYTDNRPYGVIFDKNTNSNLDSSTTLTDKTIVVAPTINIEEIIDPTSTQVEYEIELPTSEASIAWNSLPSGVSLINVGNRYILQYLSSVNDWEAVKDPTITIGDDFFGTFFYTIRIRYQTPSGQQTIRAVFGGDLPLSDMVSRANMSTQPMQIKDLESFILGVFSINVDLAVESYGLLAGPFSLTADLTYVLANGSSVQTSQFTTTALPTRIFNMGTLSYNTTATMNIVGDKLPAFDESVTRTATEGNPRVVAADAGRLIFGHNLSDPQPTDIGEILWAGNIAALDGLGLETITEIDSSVITDCRRIDIKGSHMIASGIGGVSMYWPVSDDYTNLSIGSKVDFTTGFVTVGDVAATDDYFIVGDIGYNSNAGRIHVYSDDGTTAPYSVTEEYTITLSGTSGLGFNVAANENYIVATTNGATSTDIHVFDISDGSLIRTITGAIKRPGNIDLWDKYVIVSSGFQTDDFDNGAYIYDVSTGNLHHTIATAGQLPSVAISKFFYATADSVNDEIKIYNTQNNNLWKTISNIDTTFQFRPNKIAIDEEYLIAVEGGTSNVIMYY